MREQEYVWYIEPLDARTNEIIARELQLPEHSAQREVKCKDGKKRNLWECRYDFVQRLINSCKQLRLHFRIFNKKGSYGQVREWTFWRKQWQKSSPQLNSR